MIQQECAEHDDVAIPHAHVQDVAVVIKPLHAHMANRTMEYPSPAFSATFETFLVHACCRGSNTRVRVNNVLEYRVRYRHEKGGHNHAFECDFHADNGYCVMEENRQRY